MESGKEQTPDYQSHVSRIAGTIRDIAERAIEKASNLAEQRAHGDFSPHVGMGLDLFEHEDDVEKLTADIVALVKAVVKEELEKRA